MKRMRKRSRKFHGTRSHGTGNAKNRRGKGCKGGWGRAGMAKHRFTYITRFEPDFFGGCGFSPVCRRKVKAINIFDIELLAQKGKLEKRGGKNYFEFDGKVLGTGSLSIPVVVKAIAFSEKALEKIKKAGGEASQAEGAAAEPEAEKSKGSK